MEFDKLACYLLYWLDYRLRQDGEFCLRSELGDFVRQCTHAYRFEISETYLNVCIDDLVAMGYVRACPDNGEESLRITLNGFLFFRENINLVDE